MNSVTRPRARTRNFDHALYWGRMHISDKVDAFRQFNVTHLESGIFVPPLWTAENQARELQILERTMSIFNF